MPATALLVPLLVMLAIPSPQKSDPRATGDLFAEIFQRGMARQKSMKSIRAAFTETTTSSLLVKPIIARGTIVAAPPARVRMTYVEPEPKTIVMDGRTLTVVWPKRNEREQIDIRQTQKRIDQYFTNASLDDLRKSFDITAQPDPSMRRTDRIEMIPKRKQIKEGLEKLELWIDRETVLMTQMRFSFRGGDQKMISLSDIAVDVAVNDDAFRP